MVINETAYYKNKLWCAYELKDKYGNYKEELRLFMRKESQRNMFTCPDCKEPLILCAGPIMEPFFKHYDHTQCISHTNNGTRRNLTARRILYYLAKESYPMAEILPNNKFDNGMTADIYVDGRIERFALEYLGHEIKLADWEKKHQYYIDNQIVDIWFLNYKRYQHHIGTTFEYLVSKTSPIVKLLDYDNYNLILQERCYIRANHTQHLIQKTFSVSEIRLDYNGEVICDYYDYRQKSIDSINQDIRRQFNKEWEEKRLKQLAREEEKRKRLQERKQRIGEKESGRKSVLRRTDEDEEISDLTMKMTSINELWDLPILIGNTTWNIKIANRNRYDYLRNLNIHLAYITDVDLKIAEIETAIKRLENDLEAYKWK